MTDSSTVDLLVAGGRVLDGTGAPAYRADLAVRAGRIVSVAPVGPPARRVIDATGLLVCPGFVDVHTHSDLTLLSAPEAPSRIRQGITTEVVGNCGLGPVPLPDFDVDALRAAVDYLDRDPAVAWTWRDLPGYLAAVAAARPSVNVLALVGHIPLRAATVGFAARPANAAERGRMCGLLADALDAGAAGLSTGLVYAPASYADEEELVALAEVVAARGGLFAWHVRDYADALADSVAQALRVGERAGCRTQISHLAAVGRRNWGAARRALEQIEAAHGRGLDVGVDVYPYLAGSASLFQLMPGWAQAGGGPALLDRLRDPAVRDRIAAELTGQPLGWDEISISRVSGGDESVVGASVADLAARRGRSGADVVMDLLVENDNAIDMVAGGRSDDDLRAVLAHPLTVIGSDGFSLDPDGPTGAGLPHPRSYGTYPRLLARYTGAGGLSLAEAVAKSTARAADRVGLDDRGRLRVGAAADVVLLDESALSDRATFEEPQRYPDGIPIVIVNGEIVVDDGRITGARPGAALRRQIPNEIGEGECLVR